MKAKLIKSEKRTPDIYTFWFLPEKPIHNVPGQYSEITLPHRLPDNRGISRKLTIYSSPTEKLMAFTVRFKPKGSTFKQALLNLKTGEEIRYTEPIGDFILPINQKKPLIFVSSGIGVTPLRSILKWLEDTQEYRNITIYQKLKNKQDIIDQVLFKKYQSKYFHGSPDNQILIEDIKQLIPKQPDSLLYLSGSQNFVNQMRNELNIINVPDKQIVTDIFLGY